MQREQVIGLMLVGGAWFTLFYSPTLLFLHQLSECSYYIQVLLLCSLLVVDSSTRLDLCDILSHQRNEVVFLLLFCIRLGRLELRKPLLELVDFSCSIRVGSNQVGSAGVPQGAVSLVVDHSDFVLWRLRASADNRAV